MSLTISPRTGAPLAPPSLPAPKTSESAGAPPARPETGLGTFKDGYEQSLEGANKGANQRAYNRADSSFDVEPGKVAGLARDSRTAFQSGRFRAEGSVRDAIRGHDPVAGDRDGHFGGSNWRKGSREVGTIGG